MNRHDAPRAAGPMAEAREDGANETEALRDDIEQTREEMSATLGEIQDRLAPDYLKDQAKDVIHDAAEQAKEIVQEAVREAGEQAREVVREATTQAKVAVHDATIGKAEEAVGNATRTAKGFGSTMLDTIKQNPVPAALAGIGLGWLFMKSRSNGSTGSPNRYQRSSPTYATDYAGYPAVGSGYTETSESSSGIAGQAREKAGEVVDQTKNAAGAAVEKAGGAVDQAKGIAGEVVTQAQEAAGRMAGAVQERTSQVAGGTSGQAQRLLEESPLVLGGIALATGAAIGLLLPNTRQEDQMMGQMRDNLWHQAKETAQETQPKVQRLLERAQEAVQEEAKEQQLTG